MESGERRKEEEIREDEANGEKGGVWGRGGT